MIKVFIRTVLLMLMLSISAFVNAAPAWQIDRNNSMITFSAVQNNSPISGTFTLFMGDINFDPAELKTSHVQITVSTGSVTTSYQEVQETLKTAEWFNIKLFPDAIFKADKFTQTGNNTFQANGTLTLRDKTLPVTLAFVLEEYSKTKAVVKGTTTIKRTQFGVGQGEWSKTDGVKDDVQVNFKLVAIRK